MSRRHVREKPHGKGERPSQMANQLYRNHQRDDAARTRHVDVEVGTLCTTGQAVSINAVAMPRVLDDDLARDTLEARSFGRSVLVLLHVVTMPKRS